MLHYYYHFQPEPLHTGINTFFLTLDGYPLSSKAIKSLVVRLSRSAEVPRLHPHLFRHTYATHFLINGGDVLLLKQNLGHRSFNWVVLLILIEIATGVLMNYFEFPFLTQPIHLVVASVLFGIQFYILLTATRKEKSIELA